MIFKLLSTSHTRKRYKHRVPIYEAFWGFIHPRQKEGNLTQNSYASSLISGTSREKKTE